MSTKTSLLYGLNSSMNLKLNSKTSTNNNEQEWHLINATCSGPTSSSTYLTLKNMLDKLDTPKKMLKPLIYSSMDYPPEYWQMYLNLHTLRDMRIPNKKQLTPLNPLLLQSIPIFSSPTQYPIGTLTHDTARDPSATSATGATSSSSSASSATTIPCPLTTIS